jgi:ribosomal protein S10
MFHLKLSSTSTKILNLYLLFLKKKIKSFSFIKLPTYKKRISLLKSTHVNKKAQDQFEKKIYKTLIVIKDNYLLVKNLKYLILNKPTSITLKLIKL